MTARGSNSAPAIGDPGEAGRERHGPIDRFVVEASNRIAWAFPILMAIIVVQVVLRRIGLGQAWLEDMQWWLYGFTMMAGMAYALTTGSHVRVDILHRHYGDEKKARLEAVALGWMLLPFCLIMADIFMHYAFSSIVAREGADSPNGLHGLYYLKSTLPVLFIFAALAGWSAYLGNLKLFVPGNPAAILIFAFPAAVFLLWRLFHYAAYWIVRLSNPDIHPRRVGREPLFDFLLPSAFAAIVLLLIVLLIVPRVMTSRNAKPGRR